MTVEAINDRAKKEAIKHKAAADIRAILDAAAEEYGDEWADDDAECTVIELVTEE